MNILDTPTKRKLGKRTQPIKAIVLHTTGATDLDKILDFYTRANGFQPHYFIETTGTIRRLVQDDHVAYHTKIEPNEAVAYLKGWTSWSTKVWVDAIKAVKETNTRFPGYNAWDRDWRAKGMQSPLEFVTGAHPNAVTLGIELQQPDKNLITPAIFTDEQYGSLQELLADVCPRYDVPQKRDRVLGHYDCSPMRRSNNRGNWDPGELFDWSRVIPAVPVG